MNRYASLCQGCLPDTGEGADNYHIYNVHTLGREWVQLRLRRQGSLYSVGYYLSYKEDTRPAVDVYPTSEQGVFRTEREACLYALGELLNPDRGIHLTPEMRVSIWKAVDVQRTQSLF